eukprot:IDg10112t1
MRSLSGVHGWVGWRVAFCFRCRSLGGALQRLGYRARVLLCSFPHRIVLPMCESRPSYWVSAFRELSLLLASWCCWCRAVFLGSGASSFKVDAPLDGS